VEGHERIPDHLSREARATNRTPSLDISIPRELESEQNICIECDLAGVRRSAHRGHSHPPPGSDTKEVAPEIQTGAARKLSGLERTRYGVTGVGWGMIATAVFIFDWGTAHAGGAEGFLLDIMYVTMGILAYLQVQAALRGEARGKLTFQSIHEKVKGHLWTYRDWLFEKVGITKKTTT